MKPSTLACPSCGANAISLFYETKQVPVHSVILHHTRGEALAYPKGNIHLGFCSSCGFISNTVFDPSVHEYESEYESTQAFSPTFNTFHRTLAADLVKKYGLYAKNIVEIGCGQGEFLQLLCEIGNNQGIGFDPAYIGPPQIQTDSYKINFIPDFYSQKYTHIKGDFFCCKMTLEHIHNTHEFVTTVRQAIGEQDSAVIFFQVPNARYVFGDFAFWDIYYEHCSYFTLGSLARLFRRAGFEVMDLWKGYDDQYIMIEARPVNAQTSEALLLEDGLEDVTREVQDFTRLVPQKIQAWKEYFQGTRQAGRKVVLWGGGSKGVTFLSTLNLSLEDIEFAVDVNPRKNNTFLAGSGQKVVSPGFLTTYQPDVVVVMNPIYREEIRDQLQEMNLHPELISV